jgi:segregation and condensation protein B
MEEETRKIEAILFTLGRFTDLEEISRLTGIGAVGFIKEALLKLKADYEKRESALYISNQGGKWKLNIKKDYLFLTEKLLTDAELDKPTQETLAVIAYKSPIFQSDIIKIRGNTAYDHIKVLKELEFITAEKSGRTRILKVTGRFYDYFDVTAEEVKKKLEGGEEVKNES